MSITSLPAKTITLTVATDTTNDRPRNLPILEQCKTIKHLHQFHAHAIKTGLIHFPRLTENILESAAISLPRSIAYAVSVFNCIEQPHAAAYNIMIRGYTLNQSPQDALCLFKQMREDSVEPDKYTFPCILKSCSRLRALEEGEQIHALITKLGLGSHDFVQNTLIHMYASCDKVGVARRVFDGMPERGIVTWNSMFAGYSKSGDWKEVVELFGEMIDLGVVFDEVTLISVLTACGRLGVLKLGAWINQYIEDNGLKGNAKLITALVDMYAKCGQIDTARQLFDEMTERDVVAWSAMISGYSQSNRCKDALALFHQMQMAKVDPNEITMVSVLSSCAVLGASETGKWVHSFIKRKRMKLTVTLGTALMDFYAKCGSVEQSLEVFWEMPQKNVLSWTVLIQGLASNGRGREALDIFSSMRDLNVKPNDVTFIGVLSACSHGGLVDEGQRLFDSMTRGYGIEPRIEHYGCMVDILGRAGLIDEAYQVIKAMPIEPNAIVWRTLLASCRVHKNVEIGEESLKQIVRLEPKHSGDYILLSNIYASVGRWEDALRVRTQMKEKGIKKTPGCTLIEVDGVINEFFAEDSAHPQSKEIYDTVDDMIKRLRLAGYVPNTAEARIDAEEDEKESSVFHHSEKLAIAFGLLRTSPGATIRISKNLRVCTDCHSATKMISKVYKREIVVRDRNRFHHFKEGTCSCNDYW
ncbi:pentatricopeptide repeat-containing protein At1g08070, chloroplastic-like [Magnolia sinica]|uniref:pentatricopeptide repeat-containing protein At1g08070, chloroplastic-like n=1 Tax=Magnolia sinica TaxID=86752 RepID=UPI002657BC8D|nr:pentatricopeptide repeat-containing protein At1g08070, chloroplastic-like [Magnolia sinica]